MLNLYSYWDVLCADPSHLPLDEKKKQCKYVSDYVLGGVGGGGAGGNFQVSALAREIRIFPKRSCIRRL